VRDLRKSESWEESRGMGGGELGERRCVRMGRCGWYGRREAGVWDLRDCLRELNSDLMVFKDYCM
jgi:hypothetical protein